MFAYRIHNTLRPERNLGWCKTIKLALNVIRFMKLYITTKMYRIFPRIIMMHFISVCFASAEDGDIWCFDKSNHGHLGNDVI